MNKENQYQQHIHVFRGVAIIFIVFAHTIPSLDWTDWPLTGKLIDAVANQSSIFFFFIAGYLLNPCCLQRVPAPRAPAHDFSAA